MTRPAFFLCFLLCSLLLQAAGFAQQSDKPVEVTAAISKRISQQVAGQASKLKAQMTAAGETAITIEFAIDTFKIEQYLSAYIDYDWSTAGMREASYDAADKYDSLLNKYYKKLLARLAPADRPALVNAQKAWIAFRDNELKLEATLRKDEYSGGGTIQELIGSSNYLDIIKSRVVTLYDYYCSASQAF